MSEKNYFTILYEKEKAKLCYETYSYLLNLISVLICNLLANVIKILVEQIKGRIVCSITDFVNPICLTA